jgi:hypothetical protein
LEGWGGNIWSKNYPSCPVFAMVPEKRTLRVARLGGIS